MKKVMKCFECGEIIEYDEIYQNGTIKFLIDEGKVFVGYFKNEKILCVGCVGND